MRAHTVTLVDNIAWLFGGCDEKGCARDVWCCDVGEYIYHYKYLELTKELFNRLYIFF